MSLFGFGSKSSQNTFRAKKGSHGKKLIDLRKHIASTLGSGDLREAVKLPIGEDLNEWLAVNTVDFFNQITLLYGTITEFCTPANCPKMSAGAKYEYRWADGKNIIRPISVSAPTYVDYLTEWVEAQLDNVAIFPPDGSQFPQNFMEIVKKIFKRLFRIYAHMYHSHLLKIVGLKEERHFNTCFKHFVLFTLEFGLIEKRELEPLRDVIQTIMQGRAGTSSSK